MMIAAPKQIQIQTQTRAQAPWFASWFDSPYYHSLYAHRSDTEAAGFIDALVDRLRPEEHASILDLGCGAGRHAKYLASKGFCVTGLDLAASSIGSARRWERPGLRFLRHDMRQPFGRQAFDYIFNMFTSFGYFDAAEHHRVLQHIANALRSGGRLVLDYLNVRHAASRLVPAEVTKIGDVPYLITRWSDATHFYKRIEVADLVHVERVAKFSRADFAGMFARVGLRIEAVYGDYALRPYDADSSPRLILMAAR
jgi:SAM-dependent methyltransferase